MSRLPRRFYERSSVEVADDLLGALVRHAGVTVRLTEVEAYDGANDPASHAYRGETARNAVMFGRPGHAYVYFTYGMHFCVNLVCGEAGTASAVLLRAGEVVAGLDIATGRRPRSTVRDLARGPARLTQALAIGRELNGADATAAGSPLQVHRGRPADPQQIRRGPRVGVTAAADTPWRVWLADEPTVSVYRRHVRRQRPGRTAECAGD